MPLAGKRAIKTNKYKTTSLHNDKQDNKTFQCSILQGYLRYRFVKKIF